MHPIPHVNIVLLFSADFHRRVYTIMLQLVIFMKLASQLSGIFIIILYGNALKLLTIIDSFPNVSLFVRLL